jgi:hypothetical protein
MSDSALQPEKKRLLSPAPLLGARHRKDAFLAEDAIRNRPGSAPEITVKFPR